MSASQTTGRPAFEAPAGHALLEDETVTNTESYPSIEDFLGAAENRYFGDLHRHTDHALRNLEVDADSVRATAALHHQAGWSRKASGSTPAHLGTVDALAIVTGLAETHLIHARGLTPAQRARCWLTACDMRVRIPQEQLEEIPVSAVVSRVVPGDDGLCRSTFDYAIGTIRGRCEVEHEAGVPQASRGSYATAEDVLGDIDHRAGFKQRTQRVDDVRLEAGAMSVAASVTVHRGSAAPRATITASRPPTSRRSR